ncbi:MAG: hypothetical protein WC866_03390 [Patescibacteria group bacterium]
MQRILIAVAIAFFAVTAWYGRPAGLWNSPDETANSFWIERVANGESLVVRDVLVGLGAGAIHPRSMAVVGDALVPGSFTGMLLLYGALRLLCKIPLFLLTPIFTLVAGALFGTLVGRLFDRRTGIIAAILFFLHPAVLYYAARGLFHNVLFVDLLILSAASFALRKDRLGDIFGGFAFGWAIATRTSEALWAIPAFAVFLPFIGKERWRRLGWAFVGAALPLFLLLQVNASLYGSPFQTAYVTAPALPPVVDHAAPAGPVVDTSKPFVRLPFGFDAKRVARNAWYYGISLFWWQSVLAVLGLCAWLLMFRKATSVQKTYALATVAVATWLAVLYGSWAIRDRLDPSDVTIGTSYVRYFLPAYVAMLPFAAFGLSQLFEKTKRWKMIAATLVVIGTLTLHATVFSGDESLRAVRATLAQNRVKSEALLADTFPDDVVVMTERFDKLIVPQRLRIIPGTDDASFAAAAVVSNYTPVYWYGLTPSVEERARLDALAKAHGLVLNEVYSPIPGEIALRFDSPVFEEIGEEYDYE